MSERLRRSLTTLIWPAMRLLVWVLVTAAVLVALRLGNELVVALAAVGGAATLSPHIARWVQNATHAAIPTEEPGTGTAG
jgi:hypothetical protein